MIWGSFIRRENTLFSSTQLEWNTKEEKKDFAPAESLRRDEEPPSPLNCIPTSFCLTRELHSGKLGSFPHQTLRGQKWWMGWMIPGFISFWKEGALADAPAFSLSLQNILFLTKALGGLEATSIKARQSYNIQSLVKIDGEEQLLSLLTWQTPQWFSAKPFTPRAVSVLAAQSGCSGSWASIWVWNLSIWDLNDSTALPEDEVGSTESFHAGSKSGGNKTSSKQRRDFVLTATF